MPKATSSRRYYAVAVGRTPGVYRTWADCQAQVLGHPAAVFKAFPTESAAARFVETAAAPPSSAGDDGDASVLTVYTDGSHFKGTPRRGYGAWCRYEGREYELAVQTDDDPPAVSNPTLELRAAAHVLEALAAGGRPPGVRRVVITADYAGVSHYVNFTWAAARSTVPHFATEAVRIQRAVRALIADGVLVAGRHIAGHSGVEGNDAADRLAKARAPIDTFTELLGGGGAET